MQEKREARKVNNTVYAFLMVIVIALVTALLRFLPFLVFNGKRSIPKVIQYLSSVLPYAIMAMLVVYCLKEVSFVKYTNWLPEFISVLGVVVLHVWKRNTLFSIIGGTACYMLLIRVIL